MTTTRFLRGLLVSMLCAGWNAALAQLPPGEFTLDYWMAELGVSPERVTQTALSSRLTADREVTLPEAASGPADGFAVSGMLRLKNDHRSLVRIILVARDRTEYLVYEATPLTLRTGRTQVERVCEETCVLNGVVPDRLRIEVVDAVVRLSSVATVMPSARVRSRALTDDPASLESTDRQPVDAVQEQQLEAKIKRMNENIEAEGLRWKAGATDLARMSYEERKAILARDGEIPNFQGFEYYVGGIFEIRGGADDAVSPQEGSAFVNNFDWRTRHGANDPASPYFDGDPDGGGWMTSVKAQKCGDCWAHAALGVVEAQANLFFNQQIDLDLSEQELVSCGNAGSCRGGFPGAALRYVRDSGIHEEACFPESGTDEPCANRCTAPREHIFISDLHNYYPYSDDDVKAEILEYGPISFGIYSWSHCMGAVGFRKDPISGSTIWILKNSWGTNWGDHGYGYLIVPRGQIGWRWALDGPVVSATIARETACLDTDGDGYFNWGIAPLPAASCPAGTPAEKDCNDWDASVGPNADDGSCVPIDANINPYVSFKPDPDSYASSGRTEGCPGGCVGTFRFDARLTNESRYAHSNLQVEIERLTGGNVLLTDAGHLVAGDRMPVPLHGDYADGELAAEEWMDMSFTVCLKSRQRFSFFVNVLGRVSEVIDSEAGLVGFYPFDGNTKDASGNGNDAVAYGARLVPGVIGQAYEFDGSSDYIDTPININPDVAPELTMMAWVYPHRTGGDDVFLGRRQIFSHDDGGFDRSLLMQNQYWTVFYGGGYWVTWVPVDVRAWQHVAMVIEPDQVRFYKNGIESRRFGSTGTYVSTNTLRVAANPGGWVEFFDGKIDEVRIYHRGLSASEIMDRYVEERP